MASIVCGNCGGTHPSVAEVRACFERGAAARPLSLFDTGSGDPGPVPDDDSFGSDEPPAEPMFAPPAARVPVADLVPAAELAGPDPLGRALVIRPGTPVPDPWRDAPVVIIRRGGPPAVAVESIRPLWLSRTRFVVVVPPDADDELRPDRIDGPAWVHDPLLALDRDDLAHLVWSNSVDGRDPAGAGYRWRSEALARGARPVPTGQVGDVVLAGGATVWCDGGPFTHPSALEIAEPVVHRFSIERGVLRPLAAAPDPTELAPDQLAAVTHPTGSARIVAPAGSGKTRVLTERARLLVNGWGVPASAITLVAFNTRAAAEMVARTTDIPGLQVRTLNALGLAVLQGRRPFAPRRGPTKVVDDFGQRDLLRAVVEVKRKANVDPYEAWLDALTAVRLGLRRPGDVEDEIEDVVGLDAVLERYRDLLRAADAVDFDEQITGAIEALLAEPATRATAQQSSRLLLVDEFQDLTPAHLLLVRLLAGPDAAVFGVGDDDQTIYGYTGATPRWLVGYSTVFPGAGSHPLEVNYRCPPAVVTAAANLLTRNAVRVPKEIRAARTEGEPIRTVADSPVADTIATVRTLVAAGAVPTEIAVLARVAAVLVPVQIGLRAQGVPATSLVGERFLNRTGVRAVLAWFRLALDPSRLAANDLDEAVRRPSRSLSPKVVEWLTQRRTVAEVRRFGDRLQDPKDSAKVSSFADDLEMLATVARSGRTATVLAALRDDIGLADALARLDGSKRSSKGSAQLDDLAALASLATLHPEVGSFEDWLRGELARPSDPDGVVLSTVHVVKGREFPHVIIHEATDGLFPHRLTAPDDIEEERRVFHVAMTRALGTLTIVAGDPPSPFLAELAAPGVPAPRAAPLPGIRVAAAKEAGRSGASRATKAASPVTELDTAGAARFAALREWRTMQAKADQMPAYIVAADETLRAVAQANPSSAHALLRVKGMGPKKVEQYGAQILRVLAGVQAAGTS